MSTMSSESKAEIIRKGEELRQELGYLSLPSEDKVKQYEEPLDKLKRKLKANPLIPIGLTVTTFALVYGMWQMKTGNSAMSQRMMRLRVGAQGFTVLAVLGGVALTDYQARNAKKD